MLAFSLASYFVDKSDQEPIRAAMDKTQELKNEMREIGYDWDEDDKEEA